MIPLSLREIAAITGGTLRDDAAGLVVDGPVVTDSREAAPGGLFIARVGEHADGHAFVGAAAAAGAVAALTTRTVPELPCLVVPDVQEAFAALAGAVVERVEDLLVVGVTGSSGKTTTKDLLASVLPGAGETVANVGSLNSEVGVPLTACRITPDTRFLVLEMGARGLGHIRYLTRMTRPRIGIVLNVGSAHLGEFGGRASIAAAKAELVDALPPGGVAVLNADDAAVAAMTPPPGVRVVTTGRARHADVRATDVRVGDDGAASFTLAFDGREAGRVRLRLLGEYQVANALAVAAVAREAGLAPDAVVAGLTAARAASRWRMERTLRRDGVTVVNDAYNANPESMEGALRTLAAMGRRGRAWAVLGEMLELGPDAPDLHRRLGELAGRLGIEEVLAVGDGAAPVAAGAAGARATRARRAADVDAAFALLDAEIAEGDIVLLKSSRDAGLRTLGDRLTSREVPS